METDARRELLLIGPARLPGEYVLPVAALGVVIFAHGSGSSRRSPRNVYVARVLQAHRLGTLLFDLLTEAEAQERANVFDVELLGERLLRAVDAVRARADAASLRIGLFGASTGAAAALVAAAQRPDAVAAVVSRGGRPDLAGDALRQVRAPTLLIVGSRDRAVLDLNRRALAELPGDKRLDVIPGATHLFEEPGTLASVADAAARWLVRYLAA